MLNSLKSLSLSGDSWPNYVRLEWEAGDEGIRCPPTTHFIATIDDLTDVLDCGSEDIDGMDDDEGQSQSLQFARHGATTSWYDVCTVDTPSDDLDDDKEDPVEDKPPEIQPKRRCQWRHSKSRRKKTAIPARGTTILQTKPKTKKTPSSQPPNRTIGKMGKLALMNRP